VPRAFRETDGGLRLQGPVRVSLLMAASYPDGIDAVCRGA
jgi:hypothetical protein